MKEMRDGGFVNEKRDLRHRLWQLRLVKTWQLLIILVLLLLVSATFLRLNNLGMIERRDAVLTADKRGDEEAVFRSLVDLQHYVSGHMNTSLGKGIYLEHKYERDRDAALRKASESNNPNSPVYQQASIECRARWQGGVESFRNDYVQCVIEKVSGLSAGHTPTLKLPQADMYRYDFVSPAWTPDFAGFSLLICAIIVVVIFGRLLTMGILRLILKRHYKSA
jgi:hypothetical protein